MSHEKALNVDCPSISATDISKSEMYFEV